MALAKLTIDLEARLTNLQSGMDKAVRLAEKDAARMESSFNRVRSAAGAIGGALLAGLSVRAVTSWIDSSIDAADAAIKQARSVGLLVEDLTALQFAADLSGVSQEELATGLTKLARQAKDAGDGVKASAEAFDQLGVKVRNADGSLKSQNQLLDEIADRFASLPDGINKTALATEIFGRSGAKLITLLNSGSDGLRNFRVEAERAGVVIGTETAQAAEQLNDNITLLQKRLEGVANSIAAAVVPQLNELVSRVIAAQKTFGSLAEFLRSGLIGGNNFSDVGQGVEFFTKQLQDLRAERAALGDKGGFFDAIRVGQLKGEIAEAEKLLEFYQRVASATGQLGAGGGRGSVNPAFALQPTALAGLPGKDPKAPKLPKERTSEAERYLENLRQQLQKTEDLSVAETVLADIQAGRLGTVGAQQEQALLAVAQQIDAANELASRLQAEQQQFQDFADARKKLADEGRGLFEATRTPAELLAAELSRLNLLLEEGAINWDVYARATFKAQDAYDSAIASAAEGADKLSNAAQDLGLTFASAFEDAIVGGSKLSDLLRALEQDILRIVTRKLVTEPLANGITGLLGGGPGGGGFDLSQIIGSLFGGGFATGGFLPAGQWGMAGEEGPEPIFGGRTGVTVQPSAQGAGSGGVTVYQSFNLAGTPDRRTLQQVYSAAARGVEQATRRNN